MQGNLSGLQVLHLIFWETQRSCPAGGSLVDTEVAGMDMAQAVHKQEEEVSWTIAVTFPDLSPDCCPAHCGGFF